MLDKLDITVVIAVKNEAKNIEGALKSVAWASRVYVVDSQSTDNTVEIALANGAEVVQFYYDGGWPKKRNWALANLSIDTNWVLILDGDERVSHELLEQIKVGIDDPSVSAYYLRWKFIFLGRWMKHCWSHGWMMRLFRTGYAEYENLGLTSQGGWDAEVHENIVLRNGNAKRLKGPLIHESNESLAYWVRKQNEFSTWNAMRRIALRRESFPSLFTLIGCDPVSVRKFLKAIFIRLPLRPFAMFVWLYVFRFGFLDGKAGFYFCALRAFHELTIDAKIYEAKVLGPIDPKV